MVTLSFRAGRDMLKRSQVFSYDRGWAGTQYYRGHAWESTTMSILDIGVWHSTKQSVSTTTSPFINREYTNGEWIFAKSGHPTRVIDHDTPQRISSLP